VSPRLGMAHTYIFDVIFAGATEAQSDSQTAARRRLRERSPVLVTRTGVRNFEERGCTRECHVRRGRRRERRATRSRALRNRQEGQQKTHDGFKFSIVVVIQHVNAQEKERKSATCTSPWSRAPPTPALPTARPAAPRARAPPSHDTRARPGGAAERGTQRANSVCSPS
jgi:hypothetical protein